QEVRAGGGAGHGGGAARARGPPAPVPQPRPARVHRPPAAEPQQRQGGETHWGKPCNNIRGCCSGIRALIIPASSSDDRRPSLR
ncbi:unnamed protein product, partial [Heterosigma akashiwo]